MNATIETHDDIKTLLAHYDGFHDACIVDVVYRSGSFVDAGGAMHFGEDALTVTLHSQSVKQPLVLTFSQIEQFHIAPLHDAMLGCTLRLSGGLVLWTDSDDATNLHQKCYVVSKKLTWTL